MVQILLLVLMIGLIWRLIQYLFYTIQADRMRGKLFNEAHDTGKFDPELEAEFQRRKNENFIKEAKKGRLTRKQRKQIRQIEWKVAEHYLKSMKIGPYQYIWIFVIASVLGLLLEEGWMYINFGIQESRVGLIWGPFSPLYGFGACIMTAALWPLRKRPAWQLFLISALIGTVVEQITGWGMETFAHAASWNYLSLPDHITQWIAWRFIIIWGFLGLIWVKVVLPPLLYTIGRSFSHKGRLVAVIVLAAFLTLDMCMTLAVFNRNTDRNQGIPAQNGFESWIDEHYDAKFIESRFQNLTIKDEQYLS